MVIFADNMNCKNFKIRSKKYKKYSYCTLLKKEVPFSCYKECDHKEYKEYNKIKKRTNEQSELEKSRTVSLFTNNLNICYLCGMKKEHLHEVFYGRNRSNSIKYNLFIPVCNKCHKKAHNDINLIESLHKKGQLLFICNYPELEFIKIFKENYL